ncbi:MAG: hypothetical protein JOZ77_08905 [Candidatus Eremiobacteraeota bacterium]|nr:hypothetical protein [Candidatus Eremiobacteraeota bacterium]
MQTSQELTRRPSPAPRPHPLAYVRDLLWIGSWETDRLYALDPESWNVRQEIEAPGRPYGITAMGDELRVVIAHEEDNRYLYRVNPTRGFDLASKTPCPDFTGSFLAADGSALYLGQMSYQRLLVLNGAMSVEREIALPTRCAGFAFASDDRLYMISGDDELENLQFGRLDLSGEEPRFDAIRALPDEARSLAYDGARWWTCLRDANEIASFTE